MREKFLVATYHFSIEVYVTKVSKVGVTAMTGLAAVGIGGTTLHSFMGIGTGSDYAVELLTKVKGKEDARQRLESTEILLIDEVSMLSARLFDKVEFLFRAIKKSDKPFGGIQLLLVGDFYQLGPMGQAEASDGRVEEIPACFESSFGVVYRPERRPDNKLQTRRIKSD